MKKHLLSLTLVAGLGQCSLNASPALGWKAKGAAILAGNIVGYKVADRIGNKAYKAAENRVVNSNGENIDLANKKFPESNFATITKNLGLIGILAGGYAVYKSLSLLELANIHLRHGDDGMLAKMIRFVYRMEKNNHLIAPTLMAQGMSLQNLRHIKFRLDEGDFRALPGSLEALPHQWKDNRYMNDEEPIKSFIHELGDEIVILKHAKKHVDRLGRINSYVDSKIANHCGTKAIHELCDDLIEMDEILRDIFSHIITRDSRPHVMRVNHENPTMPRVHVFPSSQDSFEID